MTEAEWLACTDPEAMLRFLADRVSLRKQRLFALACARRVAPLWDDARGWLALELAERFADDVVAEEDVTAAVNAVFAAMSDLHVGREIWAAETIADACLADELAPGLVARDAGQAVFLGKGGGVPWTEERAAQARLLRDVVGNPFVPLSPRRFPEAVVALARACYEGDNAVYPILADALDEAGEALAAAHCRMPGHVKGCHVVDWVLGKG
jgi:hypothetical protein